jgi:hypothetical protein
LGWIAGWGTYAPASIFDLFEQHVRIEHASKNISKYALAQVRLEAILMHWHIHASAASHDFQALSGK